MPLYEAKMMHQYDHRWATYEPGGTVREVTLAEKQDPSFAALPRYWVHKTEVDRVLGDRWDEKWLLGWRNIARATDERTTINSMIALAGVGHSMPLALVERPLLSTVLASFVSDYVARQKVGGTNFTFNYMQQLAVLPPRGLADVEWLGENGLEWFGARVRELTYTALEMDGAATDLGGSGGEPFVFDVERRAGLRAELDAALFSLYGLKRDEVEYVMETFPIVRRRDEAAHGEYRTKRLILESYDAMARAIAKGTTFASTLEPAPGDGPRHPTHNREAIRQ